jgi:hypothetical protein
MKFPYGLSDFGVIRQENYFYQDRTGLIPQLEQSGRQLLFLRPRRFGKSLLLSMLEYYYDVRHANQFDRLFGSLAIGQNPAPLHNSYLILHRDFSLVKCQGELEDIEVALHQCINQAIQDCADNYQLNVLVADNNAIMSLSRLLNAVRSTRYKLYLFIDEYDNFANEVLVIAHTDGIIVQNAGREYPVPFEHPGLRPRRCRRLRLCQNGCRCRAGQHSHPAMPCLIE